MKLNFLQKLIIIFIWILLPNIIINCANDELEFRIYKGRNAVPGDFPSMVSLQIRIRKSKKHICGGSLINDNTIISAGHCFIDKKNIPNYAIACDINKFGKSITRQERQISSICLHSKFQANYKTPFILTYDFAIVKVKDRFNFNKICHGLNVAKKNSAIGTKCFIAGWGELFVNDHSETKILQYGKTYITSMSKCTQFAENYDATIMTCAGDSETSACRGDSGGPLICNDRLEGVVSFGPPYCTQMPYVVFAKTSAVRKWIKNHSLNQICSGIEVSKSTVTVINLKIIVFALVIILFS